MPPRITVVTPSFNQALYLDQTLASLASQRQYIHEWFVVDGGSTDGSVEVIGKYANQIDWWVSERDQGQSDALRKGFARASGDYLYWLNSDDVSLPGAFAAVSAALERHPEWDALTGYTVYVDEASRVISMHRIPGESSKLARWGIHHVNQQTCFFRRSLYEKVGGMDVSLHCVLDTDLWCRMFDEEAVWGHVPRYLAGFRKHSDAKGVSSSWKAEYDKEEQYIREKYPQYARPNVKHRIGQSGYRFMQLLTGRYIRAKLDARRLAGKKLDEVGDILNG